MISCCRPSNLPCRAPNCDSYSSDYQFDCGHTICSLCISLHYPVRSWDHASAPCLSCQKIVSLRNIINLSKTNGKTIEMVSDKEAFKRRYGISIQRIKEIRERTIEKCYAAICCILVFIVIVPTVLRFSLDQ